MNDYPLYLPPGSVRSIIALAVVTGYMLGVVNEDIAILVLGFYFLAREGAKNT